MSTRSTRKVRAYAVAPDGTRSPLGVVWCDEHGLLHASPRARWALHVLSPAEYRDGEKALQQLVGYSNGYVALGHVVS